MPCEDTLLDVQAQSQVVGQVDGTIILNIQREISVDLSKLSSLCCTFHWLIFTLGNAWVSPGHGEGRWFVSAEAVFQSLG